MALKTSASASVMDLLARQGSQNDTVLDSQGEGIEVRWKPASEQMDHDAQLPDDYESELLAQPVDDGASDAAEPPAEERESSSTTAEAVNDLHGLLAQCKPLCSKCMTEVEPFRAQIKGKTSAHQAPKWLCNSCNSRLASLSRSFGKWPIPEFQELSLEEQQSFWKDTCLPGTTLQKMKSMLLDRVVKSRSDKVEASIHGSWLPLGVYASQGYDTMQIEKACIGDNVRDCPLLGKTYRVPITSLNRSTTETRIRESVLKSWADVSRTARSVAAAPATSADAEPETEKKVAEEAELVLHMCWG